MNSKLYNDILLAANEISKSSRSGSGSYIITSSNIGNILSGVIGINGATGINGVNAWGRFDRITKIEKILKMI